MIKNGHIFGREQSAAVVDERVLAERGDPQRWMDARDLLEFGRSPWRWRWGQDPEDLLFERGPLLTEWLAFDPGQAERYFVRRPETYEAARLECPKCASPGPAQTCTKCGQRRKMVVRPRAWTGAATVCAAWVQKQESAARRIIAPAEYDRAMLGAERITQDAAVKELRKGCDALRVLEGLWVDPGTRLEIPLWARVTLCPRENSPGPLALAQVVEPRNADPNVWEAQAYATGLHIRAALALAIWNQSEADDVREYVWIVVERDAPRLLGRRRASRELLEEGRKRLEELLGSYARCLKENQWPDFDTTGGSGLAAWTMVALQPWMTSGHGPHGGYFAPQCAPPVEDTGEPDGTPA